MSERLESDEFYPFFEALTKLILKQNILIISLTGKHLHNYLNMIGMETSTNKDELKKFTVAMIKEKEKHQEILSYVSNTQERKEILTSIASQVAIEQKRNAVRKYVYLLEMPPPRTSEVWQYPEELKVGSKTFDTALRSQVKTALRLDPDLILALGNYDDAAIAVMNASDLPLIGLPIGNLGTSVFDDLIINPKDMGFSKLVEKHLDEFASLIKAIKEEPSMKHLYRLIMLAIKGIT